MPSRKSLGGNFGEGGGGILTALGLAAPQPSEPATSATPDLETLPPLTAKPDEILRAAYWHRETLRSFLERAIEAEARRIEKAHGLDSLPELPDRPKPRR